jgi:hypothetical protein
MASKNHSHHLQNNQPKLISPDSITHTADLSLYVFLFSFILYTSTAYTSISGGDSGELIIAACKQGIAHPPGYPSFTVLYGLVIYLSSYFSITAAYSSNLLSCFLASLCGYYIYSTVYLLSSSNSWLGVYSSIIYSFSRTVWLYSIQGEVFALNNLLIAVLAYYTSKYFLAAQDYKAKDHKSPLPIAYLGAFICGLCLTNQHTTVFYVFVTILFVVASLFELALLNLSSIVRLFLCLLLGLSPYLYIPLRSFSRVMDSWGDQRTVAGFLTHFLREEYGTFQLAASETSENPGMSSRLIVYFQVTQAELLYITIPLAMIGCIVMLFSSNRAIRLIQLVFLLSYTLYLLVFHYLANLDLRPLFLGVQARFWQQLNLYLAIWAAIGLASAVQFLHKAVKAININALLAISVISISASQIILNYNSCNHSSNDSFAQQGLSMLYSFPKNSIVLLNGDLNNNMVKYFQSCENIRRDLSLLSLQLMSWDWFVPQQSVNYPQVIFPGNRYHISFPKSFNIKTFLDMNYAKNRNIFLCGPWKEGDHSNHRPNNQGKYYNEFPYGECSKLFKDKQQPNNLTQFLEAGVKGIAHFDQLPAYNSAAFGLDSWEHVLYTDAAARLLYLANYAAFHASNNASDAHLLTLAKRLHDSVLKKGRLNSFLIEIQAIQADHYRTAGVIYGLYSKYVSSQARSEEEEEANMRMYASWSQYLEQRPEDKEIRPFVQAALNPYTNKHLSNHLAKQIREEIKINKANSGGVKEEL